MEFVELVNEMEQQKRELRALNKKRADIRCDMLYPAAAQYDTPKVRTSKENKMQKYIERLEEIDIAILKRKINIIGIYNFIETILFYMPTSNLRLLLHIKYCDSDLTKKVTWLEVAKELRLDDHYVRCDLKNKAFKEADETIKNLEGVELKEYNFCSIV